MLRRFLFYSLVALNIFVIIGGSLIALDFLGVIKLPFLEKEEEVIRPEVKDYGKLVLAFYYPWYGTPDGPTGYWRHWGDSKNNPDNITDGRRDIAAAHYPLISPYDSLNESVIKYHFELAERAGIDGFIVSWWGIDTFEDKAFRKMLEVAEKIGTKVKLTIYYEMVPDDDPQKALDNLLYIINNYGKSECFLKVEGLPVVFIYCRAVGQLGYDGWRWVLKELYSRTKAFIVIDSFDENWLKIANGLHVYNPVLWLIEGKNLTKIYADVAKKVKGKGLFAATVLPGYDDTEIDRYPTMYYPRFDGKTYNETWEAAIKSGAQWVLITSFNEWHEGTEIEPSVEYGYKYIDLTSYWSKKFKESYLR